MPRFKYKARNMSGAAVFGYADAENLTVLKNGLRERGLWVIEAKVEKELFRRAFEYEKQGIKPLELIIFAKEMGVMLNSGLSLLGALSNFEEGASSRFKPVLVKIIEEIKAGKTYAEALALFPWIFSPFFIGMIEVGEAGGLLAEMHRKLASHLEQSLDLKKKLGFAAVYPSLVLAVTLIGICFILIYAFPKIAAIYTRHHVQLPLITRLMIGVSDFLIHFWYLPLALVLAFLAGAFIFKIHKRAEVKRRLDRFVLELPFYGEFMRQILLARLTMNLSLLLDSGIPLLRSLTILRTLLDNSVIQNYLSGMILSVQEGEGLTHYLRQNRFFPSILVSMARTGEESGEMARMMGEAGAFFEERVEEGVKKFVAVVEPLLIVLAAGVVFLVLIAFYLPMFRMFKLLRS